MEINDLQQHTCKNNLIITGIPLTQNENMYGLGVLKQVAQELNVLFYESDISAAHRLQHKKGSTQPTAIVVNFVSGIVKNSWLAAKRSKGKFSARELYSKFPDTPVFINEHLTEASSDIFNRGRTLVKVY